MKELLIECEHLIAIAAGNGLIHNVIFKPKNGTYERIRDEVPLHTLDYFTIKVNDISGCHVTPKHHRMVAWKASHGNVVMTTQEI